MRRVLLALAIAVTLAGTVACSQKTVVLTALDSIELGAITAAGTINASTGQPVLAQGEANKIVLYCVQAAETIQAGQSGWQTVVKTSWTSFESDLSPAEKTQFGPAIAIIDGAIGAL